jgi:uncharacterized membrane protein (UPF0127 family)
MDMIRIADKFFPTILAITDQEKELGLMYRKELPPSMTFIYKKPQINKFWMKNTICSLDIVFCANNKILDIQRGEPYSTALIGKDILSDTIIELPSETCKSNKFSVGDSVEVLCSNSSLIKIFAHFNRL